MNIQLLNLKEIYLYKYHLIFQSMNNIMCIDYIKIRLFRNSIKSIIISFVNHLNGFLFSYLFFFIIIKIENFQ